LGRISRRSHRGSLSLPWTCQWTMGCSVPVPLGFPKAQSKWLLYSSLSAYDEGGELVAVCQGSLDLEILTFKQGLLTITPTYSTCSFATSVAFKSIFPPEGSTLPWPFGVRFERFRTGRIVRSFSLDPLFQQ